MRWLQTRPGFLCFICRIKKLLQLGPTGSTWWGFLARRHAEWPLTATGQGESPEARNHKAVGYKARKTVWPHDTCMAGIRGISRL